MKPLQDATEFKNDCYLAYPHSNGFFNEGNAIVLGFLKGENAGLVRIDLGSGEEAEICAFLRMEQAEKLLWFDVAEQTGEVVTIANGAVLVYSPDATGPGRTVYSPKAPAALSTPLPSITADGQRILTGFLRGDRRAALRVDAQTGSGEVLFEHAWWANHFHFCPYDENWVGFCHEGKCEEVADRVWGWRSGDLSGGRCLFDQYWNDPARQLCVGHERWCFHEPSVMAVAYGASPGRPRGVYVISADGSTARLVSEGNRDLHVNISRTGRWAVVDTSGPHDLPGKGWENANNVSDILLIEMETGKRHWLARTRITSHPYHPHPTFSPDEKWIYFNEAAGETGRVMRVENPLV